MSFKNKKGINLISGFKLMAKSPLDVRAVVDKETDKQELIDSNIAYSGMRVYVKETKRTYCLNEDGTWEFFTKGPEYVHPTGDGNLHVPVIGSNNNGKFLMAGANPGKMSWVNITPTTIGASAAGHTHTKSEITDFPTTLKNPSALTISLNGISQGTYDGSSAKTINITPAGIGAAASSHTHNYAGSSSAGGAANSALKLTTPRVINLSGGVDGSSTFDGSGNIDISVNVHKMDASMINSGVFDIARIPKAAMERCYVCKSESDKYALTTEQVQNGDTVKVTDSGKMYYVVDQNNLNNNNGYEVYTAGSATSAPWSGITGKPSTYPPSNHTHTKSEITDFPTAIKNPSSLTIYLNGNNQGSYNGSASKSINITPANIGAATSNHTHNYAGSSSVGGAANKVANALTISLNGTSQGAYDGSSAKSINITPANIGATAVGHTHKYAGSSSAGGAATSALSANKVNNSITIKLNGTSQGAYDGSSAKEIDITPASIGAVSKDDAIDTVSILKKVYPVGAIYMSTDATNPSNIFGFGTWVLWGAGRVPICVDYTNADLNTAEKMGGSYNHSHSIDNTGDTTLSIDQIPSHNHDITIDEMTRSYYLDSVKKCTLWGSGHTNFDFVEHTRAEADDLPTEPDGDYRWASIGFNINHSHTGSSSKTGGDGSHNHTIPNTNDSSNVQPYITCYMWKRIS